MCSNLEWLVCAAKGRLPGQGNAHINFATAPKTLRTDIERSPARRGGSDIPIFEQDVFYYETCLYSQLCSNGASLFGLEQGEVFEMFCRLASASFKACCRSHHPQHDSNVDWLFRRQRTLEPTIRMNENGRFTCLLFTMSLLLWKLLT